MKTEVEGLRPTPRSSSIDGARDLQPVTDAVALRASKERPGLVKKGGHRDMSLLQLALLCKHPIYTHLDCSSTKEDLK